MIRSTTAVAVLLASPVAVAQCGAITPAGSALNLTNNVVDGWSGAISIGFAFPFEGATYTDMYLSDHGLCGLNNGGAPAAPPVGAFTYTPDINAMATSGLPLIAPYWSDHTFNGNGDIWLDSQPTQCTVTWFDVQTYNTTGVGTGGTVFSFSMTLYDNGNIEFNYDNRVNNDGSSFGAGGTLNCFVGLTADGATPAGASDLSVGAVTTTPIVYEEFIAPAVGTPNPAFDLGATQLLLTPTPPGWTAVPISLGCATSSTYGEGCGGNGLGAAFYEEFTAPDIVDGTTLTLLRSSSGYIVTDAIPGTYMPPSATAIPIQAGQLDAEQQVTLSAPMPIAGGTTTALMITTKGYISLTGASIGIDWTPTAADLLAFPEPVIAGLWQDYDQGAGGQIWFEEVGGIAYATWDAVSVGGTPDTWQMQFEIATGTITLVYETLTSANTSLIGAKGLAAISMDPGPTDISAGFGTPLEFNDSENSALTLQITNPVLGQNWDFTTTNIDPQSPITILFLSDAPLTPGISMPSVGLDAPGCFINISNVLVDAVGVSVGGTSTITWPLPASAQFAGLQFAMQSVCLTLNNPLNLLTSNGAIGTLGN